MSFKTTKRFWSHARMCFPETGCWHWHGSVNKDVTADGKCWTEIGETRRCAVAMTPTLRDLLGSIRPFCMLRVSNISSGNQPGGTQ